MLRRIAKCFFAHARISSKRIKKLSSACFGGIADDCPTTWARVATTCFHPWLSKLLDDITTARASTITMAAICGEVIIVNRSGLALCPAPDSEFFFLPGCTTVKGFSNWLFSNKEATSISNARTFQCLPMAEFGFHFHMAHLLDTNVC